MIVNVVVSVPLGAIVGVAVGALVAIGASVAVAVGAIVATAPETIICFEQRALAAPPLSTNDAVAVNVPPEV